MKTLTLYERLVRVLALSAVFFPLAAHATKSTTVDGIQVGVGDCLTVSPASATDTHKNAIAAIASAGVSQGVNYIGKALTAAGAAKTWTATGSRNFQAKTDGFPQCVIVARGTFETHAMAAAVWTAEDPWPKDTPAKLFSTGLKLHDAPAFLFEGQIVGSIDKSALTVRPLTATFSKPIGTRWFRWGKERNVVVFLAITDPGTKPTLDTAPAATLVLGKFDEDTTRQYDADLKDGGGAPISSAFESPWFSLAKSDSIKPLTISVMLSETQDESDFLTFLGSVLSDSNASAAATNGLTTLLVPSAREQSNQAAKTKANAADNDADTKLADVMVKLDACSTATGSAAITAGAAARTSLRDYLAADQAKATPEGIVDAKMIATIDPQKGSAAVIAACKSIEAQLTK